MGAERAASESVVGPEGPGAAARLRDEQRLLQEPETQSPGDPGPAPPADRK